MMDHPHPKLLVVVVLESLKVCSAYVVAPKTKEIFREVNLEPFNSKKIDFLRITGFT